MFRRVLLFVDQSIVFSSQQAVRMWQDLFSALALVLVIEGLLPFLTPGGYRKILAGMLDMDDRKLRMMGLISMFAGLFFLYLVRN